MAIVWELERNLLNLDKTCSIDYDSIEIKTIINIVMSHQRKWFLATWPILNPTSKAWVASCARPRNHK